MRIREFLRLHQEFVLIFCALGFLIFLFMYTAWGIAALTANLTQAITVKSGEEKGVNFRFEEFQKLKLPGIQ